MALTKFDITLIEKAIQSKLSQSEKSHFDRRMLDAEFSTEYYLHEEIKASATVIARENIRQTFSQWDQEEHEKTPVVNRTRILWRWAAIGLLLIGLAIVLFYKMKKPTTETLFLTFYEPYPNLVDPIEKGTGEGLQSISQLYEMDNFTAAAFQSPTDSLQHFYQALALLELEKSTNAIQIFNAISNDSTHRFHDASEWMLALSLLQDQQVEACQSELQKIILNQQHDFHKKALDLNEALHRMK